MESNNYEGFMTQTVEAMLPRFSARNLVLTMVIRADWTDFGFDEDGNTKIREELNYHREFFLAFHRPSNYTKVLLKEISIDNRSSGMIPRAGVTSMRQMSDHDSCWRSDGFHWVFQAFADAWDFFEKHNIEGRNIDPMFGYSIFGGGPQYWKLKSIKKENDDPDQRWHTNYILDFERKLDLYEISKYMPIYNEKGHVTNMQQLGGY